MPIFPFDLIHPKAMPVILQPDDYDRWLAGEPIEARAPSLWYRTSKLIQRRRGVCMRGNRSADDQVTRAVVKRLARRHDALLVVRRGPFRAYARRYQQCGFTEIGT